MNDPRPADHVVMETGTRGGEAFAAVNAAANSGDTVGALRAVVMSWPGGMNPRMWTKDLSSHFAFDMRKPNEVLLPMVVLLDRNAAFAIGDRWPDDTPAPPRPSCRTFSSGNEKSGLTAEMPATYFKERP